MAKIFRFSGYHVEDGNELSCFTKEGFEYALTEEIDKIQLDKGKKYAWQQLHIEESESFELDGEDKPNCDLALLTRHFKKELPKEYTRDIIVGGKYKHFKLGKIVTVLGVSRHTETEEVTVVYEYKGKIWNRPLEMFLSEVDHEKYPNATQKYRFELVEEFCGWKRNNDYSWKTNCGHIFNMLGKPREISCPYCGKKIKVVER